MKTSIISIFHYSRRETLSNFETAFLSKLFVSIFPEDYCVTVMCRNMPLRTFLLQSLQHLNCIIFYVN